ncbi:MAG: decaprenyl-phosphate phosphoribosyltransferase [Planctomycetota bacterium]|nr:decaprenyl-phosphate phosphoribosyltransferase [Planctomycetota bacterium]
MVQSLRAAILLTRPPQWIKNVFVFAGLVFGSKLRDPHAVLYSLFAFAIFCMLSSAIYALNDGLDYREDAQHPAKKNRPVASGAIAPSSAIAFGAVLAILALLAAYQLPKAFFWTALAYLAVNVVYSFWGKQRVLLDVILISIGFVLRALAGAEAIEVEVSAWLVICTFTLCLFLGFGKRRCELAVIGDLDKAASHRSTLLHYTPNLLNQLLATTGGIAIITFLLYTMDPNAPARSMVFTTPFVVYAIFRYAMVIERGVLSGPTDVLIKDRPFLATAIIWALLTLGLLYGGDRVEEYLPKIRYPGQPVADVEVPDQAARP